MAYFDLRLPLGWLFTTIGALLLAAGVYVSPISSDGHSVGMNINLIWGVALLAFGIICLGTARNYSRKHSKPNGNS